MHRYLALAALFVGACSAPVAAQNQGAFSTSYTLEYEQQYARAQQPIKGLADAGNEFARLRLGWLAYLAGNYNESITHYNAVLQANPTSIDGRLGLTLPLLAQKRWQDAAAQARQVLAQSPWDYYAHARLMVCEEGLKDWPTLEQHALAATRVWGSDANAFVYLARARIALGNLAGAKQAYGQVLERLPQHAEALAFMRKNS
ncbi:MAG TPA: tetratricopeptide repeat protein [Reyranella sp.]|nr:tetratricopeptide repeat protein [Reyranella sp.]